MSAKASLRSRCLICKLKDEEELSRLGREQSISYAEGTACAEALNRERD